MSDTLSYVAPLPANEEERLAALRSYDLLAGSHEEALDAICRVVSSVFCSKIALVSLSDTNRQVFKGRVGLEADELARDLAPCAHAILGTVPFVVSDARQDPRFVENPLVVNPPNVRFYVGMPLLSPDRYALGTLCAINDEVHSPSGEEISNLVDLSRTVMDMFNLRRAMSRARNFALTDVLTGLANRAGLMLELEDVIEASRGTKSAFALLYLDVDNFKYVNDTRGHAAGDSVLQLIADTLRGCVRRSGDLAGRLGGDEFAILIPETDEIEANVMAERILARLNEAVQGQRYPVGFSIGLACFPTPPRDVSEAFLIADRLMYAAKHGGKNRIVALSSNRIGAGL
jgi:diguanylate cyclase (GGDEF)-like protein